MIIERELDSERKRKLQKSRELDEERKRKNQRQKEDRENQLER